MISFSTGGNAGSVYEMSPAGSLVRDRNDFSRPVRVLVTDPDLGPSDPTPDYVYTTSEPTLYGVDSDGYITVVKADLDYENPQHRSVSMQITVRERDNPQQTATAVFSVQLIDINDNSPVFDQQTYAASMNPGGASMNVTAVGYIHRYYVYTYG